MTTVADRRKPRRRVLKEAKIIYLNNGTLISCQVRDLSETGARLICGEQVAVPSAFRFMLTGEKTYRLAQVVWRNKNLVGIAFTGQPEPAPVFRMVMS